MSVLGFSCQTGICSHTHPGLGVREFPMGCYFGTTTFECQSVAQRNSEINCEISSRTSAVIGSSICVLSLRSEIQDLFIFYFLLIPYVIYLSIAYFLSAPSKYLKTADTHRRNRDACHAFEFLYLREAFIHNAVLSLYSHDSRSVLHFANLASLRLTPPD